MKISFSLKLRFVKLNVRIPKINESFVKVVLAVCLQPCARPKECVCVILRRRGHSLSVPADFTDFDLILGTILFSKTTNASLSSSEIEQEVLEKP